MCTVAQLLQEDTVLSFESRHLLLRLVVHHSIDVDSSDIDRIETLPVFPLEGFLLGFDQDLQRLKEYVLSQPLLVV